MSGPGLSFFPPDPSLAPVAVVPIFVNAGAAVLPAVLAGAASVLTLLLNPRALWRACRRRPVVPAVVLAGGVGLWLAAGWLFGGAPAQAARRPGQPERRPVGWKDWEQIGRDLIARDKAGPLVAVQADARPLGLGRDFARSGYGGGPPPLGLGPLWRHRDEETMYLSSPLVAGERVYGASCQFDVTGKYGKLFCLDAKTGKPLWETTEIGPGGEEPLKPFFSSPALSADGKSLVIGQGLHDDKDCSLLCFDADTGQLRWRVKTPLHLESSPAIHGGVAVVGAGAIEGKDHQPQGDPGYVLAVRVSDGAELWRHPLADPESSPAVAADGTVYIGSGFNGNAVVALRPEPDAVLREKKLDRVVWRAEAPYPVTGAVTLAGDMVIVGAGNSDYVFANPNPAGVVLALDRKTGEVRWKTPMPDAVLGPVAHHEGKLVCPVRNGEVVALDAADGKPLWRQRVSGDAAVLAGPAFTGGHVYAASRDGYLAVLDAADGKVLEKVYLNDEAKPGELGLTLSTPTVVGGRVFVGSETGGLRCYAGKKAEAGAAAAAAPPDGATAR